MGYFAEAGMLLLDLTFGLLALLFVSRVLLQWVGAPFHNPVCQTIYRFTNPVLTPLRRLFKPWRRIDVAGAVFSYLILTLKAALLLSLIGATLAPSAILLLGLAETIQFLLTFYFWLILAWAIMSWVGNRGHHPIFPLLAALTAPVLRPIRRLLPPLGGMDLSPLLLTLGILLARILIVAPLRDLAIQWASLA